MLAIEPVTVMSLMILAASPSSEFCQQPKPAQININPTSKAVKYDYSQSLADLQLRKVDTINPYGYDKKTHTNGYMDGVIDMRTSVKLGHKFLPKYNAYCLWYESIDISINLYPHIVIAKEIADDKCMHKAVKTHELKHVKVDKQIANKYAKSIGKTVYDGLKSRGFLVGPIRAEQAEEVATRMKETAVQLTDLEYKKLEIERAERQQAVDTLQEYEHVSAQCPDYRSPALKE